MTTVHRLPFEEAWEGKNQGGDLEETSIKKEAKSFRVVIGEGK